MVGRLERGFAPDMAGKGWKCAANGTGVAGVLALTLTLSQGERGQVVCAGFFTPILTFPLRGGRDYRRVASVCHRGRIARMCGESKSPADSDAGLLRATPQALGLG